MMMMKVKQLMEESVTRKFVHEESSTVTSLCSKCLPLSPVSRVVSVAASTVCNSNDSDTQSAETFLTFKCKHKTDDIHVTNL